MMVPTWTTSECSNAGSPVPVSLETTVESVEFYRVTTRQPAYDETPAYDIWTQQFGLKSRAPRLESMTAKSIAAGTYRRHGTFHADDNHAGHLRPARNMA